MRTRCPPWVPYTRSAKSGMISIATASARVEIPANARRIQLINPQIRFRPTVRLEEFLKCRIYRGKKGKIGSRPQSIQPLILEKSIDYDITPVRGYDQRREDVLYIRRPVFAVRAHEIVGVLKARCPVIIHPRCCIIIQELFECLVRIRERGVPDSLHLAEHHRSPLQCNQKRISLGGIVANA